MSMAVSLSNNFSLYTPLSFSKPSSTRQFKTLAFHSKPPIAGVSFSRTNYLSPVRRSLESSLFTVSSSTSEISEREEAHPNDVEMSNTDGDKKNSLSLKSLLKVYKEAILVGDRKTTSDIESMISIVENEKNELVVEVSDLSAEIKSGKEKYIRLQADFDNFRKRSEKERLTVRRDAQGEVIQSLLPMVDNFERAKQQLKIETDQEKKIDASYQGIYKQFVEIMRSLRVAVVATVGKPFDPSVHEAIAREESQEFKEGIVVEEFRRGFLLGDQLLRPAMVKVSAGPGKKKPSMAAMGHTEQTAKVVGSSGK